MNEFLQTARENLSFLLICLVVFIGLVLVARLAEKFLIKQPQRLLAGINFQISTDSIQVPAKANHLDTANVSNMLNMTHHILDPAVHPLSRGKQKRRTKI